jgi:hypothetical protein
VLDHFHTDLGLCLRNNISTLPSSRIKNQLNLVSFATFSLHCTRTADKLNLIHCSLKARMYSEGDPAGSPTSCQCTSWVHHIPTSANVIPRIRTPPHTCSAAFLSSINTTITRSSVTVRQGTELALCQSFLISLTSCREQHWTHSGETTPQTAQFFLRSQTVPMTICPQ